MGTGLQLASGRVIALGRWLLATLLLAAIWADASQPVRFPTATHILLIGYAVLALALVVVAWASWWLDAGLAGSAHAIDIGVFTVVVFLTEGDTSPYLIFCIFVLLAAAIRWGWRATALTAVLLTLLYGLAGWLIITSGAELDVDRFATRAAYLVIVSLIIIWFGVNQWRRQLLDRSEAIAPPPGDLPPVERSLRMAMSAAGAGTGAFLWWTKPKGAAALVIRDGAAAEIDLETPARTRSLPGALLYEIPSDRAVLRDRNGNLRRSAALDHIDAGVSSALQLREGLAIPTIGEHAGGQLYLEGIRGLSPDHLDLGDQIGAALDREMQRQAVIQAAEESAESRSRLTVARDLHDSVVQFLAGIAFRLEAMKRSERLGRDLEPELDELKELVLQEQSELRAFITALRTGSQIRVSELAKDLQSLTNRLATQWGVQCTFSLEPSDLIVPSRLHLDAQQLVREAVANAVRHAGAKNVSIRLAGASDELRLDFINDGTAYPRTAGGNRMPHSLRERVEAIGGALEISRGMGVTKVSVSLPTNRKVQ